MAPTSTSSATSRPASRRCTSRASGRCPTCRRRTTGTGATSPSTSGSRARVHGRRVVDLACGEGYGSAVLGRTAASVVGVDANPEAFEHARLKYSGAGVCVRARHDRDLERRRRLRRVPADDRARAGPRRGARPPARPDRPARRRLRLDAERADARAGGRRRAPATRGTCASTGPRSTARCASATSARVDLLGLFHARKLRLHQLAIERAGWDAVHARLRHHQAVLRPLHAGDLRARLPRCGAARSTARSTCSPCCAHEPAPGALAIVLHTHMPYVEGFGTWPFGEEWLWEAVATLLPAAARRARRGARAASRCRSRRCSATSSRRRARSSAARRSCARSGPSRTGSTSRPRATRA